MTTRTYVLDTSVLLSDPKAVTRFDEHSVILPLVVISELEGKRHHHELGWFAREALRHLDDLRLEYGRLDEPIPIGECGGTLQVELNHTDPRVLPSGFRTDDNDSRILACALNLRAEGRDVTLVTKDTPLRVKAGAVGLAADEYHAQDVVVSGWTGMTELEVTPAQINTLFDEGVVDIDEARDMPCHTGIRLLSGRSSALGRVNAEKRVQLVRGDREAFGLHGRSAEQRVALDLLLDDSVGIVSLGGKAGTGKSALALCAGLEAVLERRTHRKVVVFRPLYAVGGQQLGYLPGSEADKMGPWAQAVFDTLEGLASTEVIDEVASRVPLATKEEVRAAVEDGHTDEDGVAALLRTVNDLRLMIGTELGISEDDDTARRRGGADRLEFRAQAGSGCGAGVCEPGGCQSCGRACSGRAWPSLRGAGERTSSLGARGNPRAAARRPRSAPP